MTSRIPEWNIDGIGALRATGFNEDTRCPRYLSLSTAVSGQSPIRDMMFAEAIESSLRPEQCQYSDGLGFVNKTSIL